MLFYWWITNKEKVTRTCWSCRSVCGNVTKCNWNYTRVFNILFCCNAFYSMMIVWTNWLSHGILQLRASQSVHLPAWPDICFLFTVIRVKCRLWLRPGRGGEVSWWRCLSVGPVYTSDLHRFFCACYLCPSMARSSWRRCDTVAVFYMSAGVTM